MTPLEIARCVAARDHAALERLVHVLAGDGDASRDAWLALERGGLLPQTSVAMERSGLASGLTPRHQQTLRSAVETSALRNALLRRLAVALTRRLAEAGIPVLWTKGVWLAHFVYEQPAMRVMSDVDVFVPPGRRAEAVEILRGAGFVPDRKVEAAGLEVFADSLQPPPAWLGEGDGLSAEIHDGLRLSPRRVWPIDEVWTAATVVRTARIEALVPRAEDGLRLAAIHAMKHGLDLRHLLAAVGDTVAMCRRPASPLDVEGACRQLGEPFEAASLYLLLSAAGGASLPPSGQEIFARATAAVERHGTRRRADRLLAAADHPRFVREHDFSLFGVAEAGFSPSAVTSLLRSSLRWRRRVVLSTSPGGAWPPSRLSPLARANWRWAWTSFLAGRLSGQLARRDRGVMRP